MLQIIGKIRQLAHTAICFAFAVSAQHAVEGPKYACAIADYKKNEICLITKTGEITTRYKIGRPNDVWVLADGSIAFSYFRGMKVIDQSGKELFEWAAPKKERVEIHGIQPLPNGNFMIGRNEQATLIEVNSAGETIKTIPVPSKNPSGHGRYRMSRKLLNGNYLVALKRDQEIREVDGEGKTVRSISTNTLSPHVAIRLPNGNTLYSAKAGKGSVLPSSIFEIDPADNIVWSLDLSKLPGKPIKAALGMQRLKNGNTILAGYQSDHHIVEITPEKEVVWKWVVPDQISVSAIHVFEGEGDPTTGEVLR